MGKDNRLHVNRESRVHAHAESALSRNGFSKNSLFVRPGRFPRRIEQFGDRCFAEEPQRASDSPHQTHTPRFSRHRSKRCRAAISKISHWAVRTMASYQRVIRSLAKHSIAHSVPSFIAFTFKGKSGFGAMGGTRASESSRFRCSGKVGKSALPQHWDVPFGNRSANRSIDGRKSGHATGLRSMKESRMGFFSFAITSAPLVRSA
jgi:hypothetical protein